MEAGRARAASEKELNIQKSGLMQHCSLRSARYLGAFARFSRQPPNFNLNNNHFPPSSVCALSRVKFSRSPGRSTASARPSWERPQVRSAHASQPNHDLNHKNEMREIQPLLYLLFLLLSTICTKPNEKCRILITLNAEARTTARA